MCIKSVQSPRTLFITTVIALRIPLLALVYRYYLCTVARFYYIHIPFFTMHEPSERLRWAIINDHLSMVMRIIKRNPDLLENPNPENGWTSLHYAGYHGRYLVCVFLIQSGHDRDEISLDFERNTPLHLAAKQNQEQTVHYLSQHLRRCLDWPNNDLDTPLIVAAKAGHQPCITLLLDFGADVDKSGKDGNRAIHISAAYGHLKAIRTLVDRKADTSKPNDLGWTPLDYSYSYQVKEYMSTLINERRKNTPAGNHGTPYTPFSKPAQQQKSPLKSQKPAPKPANYPLSSSNTSTQTITLSTGAPSSNPLGNQTSAFASTKLPTGVHANAPSAPSPLHHSTILNVPVVAKPQNFHAQKYQFPLPPPPTSFPSQPTPISSPKFRPATVAKPPARPEPVTPQPLDHPNQQGLPYPSSRNVNPQYSPVISGTSSPRSRSGSSTAVSSPSPSNQPPLPPVPSTPGNTSRSASNPTQQSNSLSPSPANVSPQNFKNNVFGGPYTQSQPVQTSPSPRSNSLASPSTSPINLKSSPNNNTQKEVSQITSPPVVLKPHTQPLQPINSAPVFFGPPLQSRGQDTLSTQDILSDPIRNQPVMNHKVPIKKTSMPLLTPTSQSVTPSIQLNSKGSAHSLRPSKSAQSLKPSPKLTPIVNFDSPPLPPPPYSTTGITPNWKSPSSSSSSNSSSPSSPVIPHAYNNPHSSSTPDFPYHKQHFPISPPKHNPAAVSASKHAVALSNNPAAPRLIPNSNGTMQQIPDHMLFQAPHPPASLSPKKTSPSLSSVSTELSPSGSPHNSAGLPAILGLADLLASKTSTQNLGSIPSSVNLNHSQGPQRPSPSNYRPSPSNSSSPSPHANPSMHVNPQGRTQPLNLNRRRRPSDVIDLASNEQSSSNSFYKLNPGPGSRQVVSATNLSSSGNTLPLSSTGLLQTQPIDQLNPYDQKSQDSNLPKPSFYELGKSQGNRSVPNLDRPTKVQKYQHHQRGYPQTNIPNQLVDVPAVGLFHSNSSGSPSPIVPPPIPPKRIFSGKRTPPDNIKPKTHESLSESHPPFPPKSIHRKLNPATENEYPLSDPSQKQGEHGKDQEQNRGQPKNHIVAGPKMMHPKPVKPAKPAHLNSFVRTPSPRNQISPITTVPSTDNTDSSETSNNKNASLTPSDSTMAKSGYDAVSRSVSAGSSSTIGPVGSLASNGLKASANHGNKSGGRLAPFAQGDGELALLNTSASSSSSSLATLMAGNNWQSESPDITIDRIMSTGPHYINHNIINSDRNQLKHLDEPSKTDNVDQNGSRETEQRSTVNETSSFLQPLHTQESNSSLSSVSSVSSAVSASSANSGHSAQSLHSTQSMASGNSANSGTSNSSSQSAASSVAIHPIHSGPSTHLQHSVYSGSSHGSVSMLKQARNHVKDIREQHTGDRKKKEKDQHAESDGHSSSSFNLKKPHNILQQIASHYTSPIQQAYNYRDQREREKEARAAYQLQHDAFPFSNSNSSHINSTNSSSSSSSPSSKQSLSASTHSYTSRLGLSSHKHSRKSSGSSLSSVDSVQILPLSPKSSTGLSSKFGSPRSPKRERKSFDR